MELTRANLLTLDFPVLIAQKSGLSIPTVYALIDAKGSLIKAKIETISLISSAYCTQFEIIGADSTESFEWSKEGIIKAIQKKKGLIDRQAVADAIGIKYSSFSAILRGDSRSAVKVARALADFLNVTFMIKGA